MTRSDLLKERSPSPSSSVNKSLELSPFEHRYLERYQKDLRLTRNDLLALIVELDQLKHSNKSLVGQLKFALPQTRIQIKAARLQSQSKIKDKLELYERIKDEVYRIDRRIRRLVIFGEVKEMEMRKRIKV